MKITPAKNYKKPLYAIGVTAAVMAVAVTGCTDPFSPVRYAGGMQIETGETEGTKTVVKGKKIEQTEPVALAGDVAICTDETYDLILEGEAAVEPDWTEPDTDDEGGPVLSGAVSIADPDETT